MAEFFDLAWMSSCYRHSSSLGQPCAITVVTDFPVSGLLAWPAPICLMQVRQESLEAINTILEEAHNRVLPNGTSEHIHWRAMLRSGSSIAHTLTGLREAVINSLWH